MLIEPTTEQVEAYLDTAFALSLDPTRSGYPTYTDGIKTREDFEETMQRGLRHPERQILLLVNGGRAEGLIHFFFLPDDRYLQTVIFSIAGSTSQALAEFEAYCRERFPGYDVALGFPEDNVEAVRHLSQNGWDCIERSYNDVLHFRDYRLREESGDIVRVTRENFGDFRCLHQSIEGTMYWNADRISEKLDQWIIWLYRREGVPAAAIYYKDAQILTEIFGLDFAGNQFDREAFQLLTVKALNECKRGGCRHMVFFNDAESQQAALDCGFTCVGVYVAFQKKV